MRKLKCLQRSALCVQDVLDEFNERADEFNIISESDIVSVTALPPTLGIKIATDHGSAAPMVVVVIVYWENE